MPGLKHDTLHTHPSVPHTLTLSISLSLQQGCNADFHSHFQSRKLMFLDVTQFAQSCLRKVADLKPWLFRVKKIDVLLGVLSLKLSRLSPEI